MPRLTNRNQPLPSTAQPRVADSATQRAFDLLYVPLREVLRFLQPWVQAEKWKPIDMLNSWVNFSTAFNSAQYRKDPQGRVYLRGLVKRTVAGYVGVPICALPVGYRPTKTCMFATVGNNKHTRLDVDKGGVVTVAISDSATPEAFLSLDVVSFDTVNE